MSSIVLSFFFLLATTTAPQPASRTQEAALGQEFELKFGQQVSIKEEGLKISFSQVAEDSRCPTGVQCIWAGNARVVLKLNKARRRSTVMSLNTGVEPKQKSYGGYEVKLLELNPYPKEGAPIRKRNYVAKLVVSRKSP
jgi:hypothetical protein